MMAIMMSDQSLSELPNLPKESENVLECFHGNRKNLELPRSYWVLVQAQESFSNYLPRLVLAGSALQSSYVPNSGNVYYFDQHLGIDHDHVRLTK